ncbi:hypothetical protein [Alteromonas gracilis]|uniref:carboxypeptidase-like regulatory domain-containing protein n=1 Tax=Alteromonas gracilis TaxID=1479524 RepID=UPI003735E4DD
MFRFIACLLIAFSSNAHSADCEIPKSFKRVSLNEDNFYITVLRLNGRPIWDGMDLYEVDGRFLIPISLLVDAMGLTWDINIPSNSIASNATEAQCSFNFTLSSTHSTSGDTPLWSKDEFDLYIDLAVLPLLIPITYEFDRSLQVLTMASKDLAFIDTTQEESIAPTLYVKEDTTAGRVIGDAYTLYTSPLSGYRVSLQNNNAQSQRVALSVNSTFDLLQHATNFRVNKTDNQSQHFLRFSRTFNDMANVYNDNGLTYEFGDIQLQGDNVVLTPSQSLGAVIHNNDSLGRGNFSKTTIEEFILPGWRVQLFRNGQFIDERFSDDENKVLFEDVDTFFGTNHFELKLFGPEGQYETRNQIVDVGRDQIQKNKIDFSFGVSDNQYRLLDGKISDNGLGKAALARAGVGLTDTTSLSGTYQRLWLSDIPQNYYTGAINTQLPGSSLHISLTKQENNGHASFIGWNGRTNQGIAFNFSSRYLDDFTSQRYTENSLVKSETSMRVNGQLDLFGRLGWNANLSYLTFKKTSDSARLGLNMNNNFLGGTFSGGIVVGNNVIEPLTGRLYYSKQIEGWQISSAWDFTPSDSFDTENFYVALRWPYLQSQHRETRVQYRANGDKKLEIHHQHNWSFDFINVGFGGAFGEGGDWSINLTLTGNLNYNPYSKTLNFNRASSPVAGRVDAFAFLDSNRNSLYDPDEMPLESVRFQGNANWRNEYTNGEGKARLITLRNSQTVSIDATSLPDLYMIPADKNVEVITHSGGINRVNFPVHTVSDVEGNVFLMSDTQSRGAPRVLLNVVDESGESIASTFTESDGYFYVSQLPPGKYKLKIDEEYLLRNALTIDSSTLSFVAPLEGDAIYMDDIKLTKANIKQSQNELVDDALVAQALHYNTNFIYEIQIGIFRHARSIFEVTKHLPVSTSIQYYRNHDIAMTYVTVGGFNSLKEATQLLNTIQTHPVFAYAFISPVTRYQGNKWSEVFIVDESENTITVDEVLSKNTIKTHMCQLSAYLSKRSINPEIQATHSELLLVTQQVGEQKLYRLLAPLRNGKDCVDDYLDHQYREKPFIVSSETRLN